MKSIISRFLKTMCPGFHQKLEKFVFLTANVDFLLSQIDIKKVKPATGKVREIQLNDLDLLVELRDFLSAYNLNYWLDDGTLLGAFRHKGFIPWDDDMDVGMFRDDYEQFLDLLLSDAEKQGWSYSTNSFTGTDASWIQLSNSKGGYCDIYPYDVVLCSNREDLYTKWAYYVKILKKKKRKAKISRRLLTRERYQALNNEFLQSLKSDAHHEKYVVSGLELTSWFWQLKYDDIVPFKEIMFEGELFSCPNNNHEILKEKYGDYMSFPNKLVGHHQHRLKE